LDSLEESSAVDLGVGLGSNSDVGFSVVSYVLIISADLAETFSDAWGRSLGSNRYTDESD
jgi:hypothetical protein